MAHRIMVSSPQENLATQNKKPILNFKTRHTLDELATKKVKQGPVVDI